MLCSVTEDSSFDVAASHLSAAFASGAFPSLSWAATSAACANHKQIPAAQRYQLFFMRLLSRIELCLALFASARFYVPRQYQSKEAAAAKRNLQETQPDQRRFLRAFCAIRALTSFFTSAVAAGL